MLALAKNQRLHQRYVYLDTFGRIYILVARDSLCVTCVDCQSLVLDGCVRDNCILVFTPAMPIQFALAGVLKALYNKRKKKKQDN